MPPREQQRLFPREESKDDRERARFCCAFLLCVEALGCLVLCFLTAGQAFAQPVPSRDPDATHIFPAGAQRGTSVHVRVGTECFPPGAELKFYGDGIVAASILADESSEIDEPSPRRKPVQAPISYPREWDAQIEVAADAEPGPRHWRVVCAQGGSRTRVFVVGDLPEMIERESNSLPERAMRVDLPITINGRIAGERDLDYYTFTADEGQVITCEMMASRLGSPLDPVVTFYDPQGRRLPAQETNLGSDQVLSFRAPADGDYRLLIANVSLHGGPSFIYRATITRHPRPLLAFPPGGQAGTQLPLDLLAPDGDGGWRRWNKTVTLPDSNTTGSFWLTGADDARLRLLTGTLPETCEGNESNDAAETAEPVTWPQTVNGRFDDAEDEDWFRITARRDQRLSLRCTPAPLASQAAPVLSLFNSDGQLVKEVSSFQTLTPGCALDWKCPRDGEYLLRLRDVRYGSRGGTDFIYRLTITDEAPSFALTWPREQLNVTPGDKTTIELQVDRWGGFAEPIQLEFGKLPPGVSVEPQEVPQGKQSVKLTFSADDDARPTDVPLQITGTARIGDVDVRRKAHAPHAAQDAGGASVGESTIEVLYLTVRHKPVFRLYCSEAYLYAHRGMIYPYLMQVERLDGYTGEVVLQSGDRQNRDLDGVDLMRNMVPGDVPQTFMPIYLPESMHANVQSQSQLYVQGYTRFIDRWGGEQSLLVVSEKRCMLRTLPTVVKLKAAAERVSASPGGVVDCELYLQRTSNFQGPVRIELAHSGDESQPQARPVTIAQGESQGRIKVRFPDDATIGRSVPLRFRATGDYPGHMSVISETIVEGRVVD